MGLNTAFGTLHSRYGCLCDEAALIATIDQALSVDLRVESNRLNALSVTRDALTAAASLDYTGMLPDERSVFLAELTAMVDALS